MGRSQSVDTVFVMIVAVLLGSPRVSTYSLHSVFRAPSPPHSDQWELQVVQWRNANYLMDPHTKRVYKEGQVRARARAA